MKCEDCGGKCCKQGFTVFFTREEVDTIYEKHGISDEHFMRFNPPNGPLVVWEKIDTSDTCYFLIDDKCSIYESRPKMCREYDCAEDQQLRGSKLWQ